MKFLQANRIAPDGTPRSAASHLGLFCLPMSHKRDARIKRVNHTFVVSSSHRMRYPMANITSNQDSVLIS